MRRLKASLSIIAVAGLVGISGYWATTQVSDLVRIDHVSDRASETLSEAGLNVEAVTVEGRINTSSADLLDALGAVRGTPILDIDVPQARERITALPWVRSANIVRHLPSSLHIKLEEHTAFALWQDKGTYRLVARDGTTITESQNTPANMPLIVGAEAPNHAAALFDALVGQPHLAARVKAAVRLSNRRWNLILDDVDNGAVIKLPEHDVTAAWDFLASTDRKHGLLNRAIAEIDLRIAGRLVVKLQDGYAPQPAESKDPTIEQDVQSNRDQNKKNKEVARRV